MAEGGCIFCAIAAGGASADLVHETSRVVAFRDLNPQAPVHVLVVPRQHVENASALDESHGELLAEMLVVAREVATEAGVAGTGYRLVFNVGEDALNSVPHLHLHVIGGRRLGWPPG